MPVTRRQCHEMKRAHARPRSRWEARSELRAGEARSEIETCRSRVRRGVMTLPTPAGLRRRPRSGEARTQPVAVQSLVICGTPAVCQRPRFHDRKDAKGP